MANVLVDCINSIKKSSDDHATEIIILLKELLEKGGKKALKEKKKHEHEMKIVHEKLDFLIRQSEELKKMIEALSDK